jgi:succinate dehydrogenase / fumarate reductase cytochrome b subunit
MATVAIGARETRPARFWDSTNGKKVVMAVTGAILVLFVIVHMVGNLQTFVGPQRLNDYSRLLHGAPEVLWAIRAILLASVILHIWAATQLAIRNKQARPVQYAKKQNHASSYASRTMYWSGPILLAFVIFHILHFTAGVVHPGADFVEGDVYHNVVAGIQVWYVSAWYIFSMILLGLHMRHGVWSMFQSVGFNHPRHTPILRKAATVLSIIIVVGFISIPVSVLFGWVR